MVRRNSSQSNLSTVGTGRLGDSGKEFWRWLVFLSCFVCNGVYLFGVGAVVCARY
jgi:hypothetical protein